jgi:hypothetical protein
LIASPVQRAKKARAAGLSLDPPPLLSLEE